MTVTQHIITIALLVAGTMLTRFLPFMVFSENRETPAFIKYIGKYLPGAVFGMLVIYSIKDVSIFESSHGIPEFISIIATTLLHLWKRQMLLSIAGGTALYMILIHFVFI